jgi:hypothetical protein
MVYVMVMLSVGMITTATMERFAEVMAGVSPIQVVRLIATVLIIITVP